jgi:type III restriction enzyme
LRDSRKAYNRFWERKANVSPGSGNNLHPYTTTVPGVLRVTVKVPTAGGKTYIACNALEKMFNTLQIDKPKVVAWFVPSDTILAQTLNNLRNPSHPYRQRIERNRSFYSHHSKLSE